MLNKKDNMFSLYWAKKVRAINILGGKCNKCGNNNIFVMEFHHNGNDKDFKISGYGNMFKHWSKLLKEIEKCSVLCANCHCEEHYTVGRSSDKKREFLISMGKEKCDICGYHGQNLNSLCFHHNGNKLFNVSNYFARKCVGTTLADLQKEVEKCNIICKNCHILRHSSDIIENFNRLKEFIDFKIENHQENQRIDKNVVLGFKNEGKSMAEISRIIGTSRSAIHYILRKSDLC